MADEEKVRLPRTYLPNKLGDNGIVLIPQPSDDPADPLNWPTGKKLKLLAVLCIAAFSGTAGALAGDIIYPVQAAVYKKTPFELSYSVSAALAGTAGGPLIFAPLAVIFGRPSVVFWSLLACLGCGIWAACMTGENDYTLFVISRLLSGVFGSLPSNVGASMLLDVFFLHQRGRVFVCYSLSNTSGFIVAPTVGGFILKSQAWPVCFWWTVALLGVAALLVFGLLDETGYDRKSGSISQPTEAAIGKKIWTFFSVAQLDSRSISLLASMRSIGDSYGFSYATAQLKPFFDFKFAKHAAIPFLIGLSPAPMLAGIFIMVFFGWTLLLYITLPVYLQSPVDEGGYGFAPVQNAAFSFSSWFALIAAQIFGVAFNDAFPLWICRRFYQKIWAPEIRLYSLVLPLTTMPIGLAISAAALAHHYHFMVLALGVFIAAFSGLLAHPVIVNYVVECFTAYSVEATIIVTLYRLGWGIVLVFIAGAWEARLGVGWMFGMAAIFSMACGLIMVVLVRNGSALRSLTISKSLVSTEADEGVEWPILI